MLMPLFKGSELVHIDSDDIFAITSNRNKIEFETTFGVLRPLMYLKDFRELLYPAFGQIDISTLIRTDAIVDFDRIKRTLTLLGTDKVYSVSKSHISKIESLLN